MHRTHGLSQSKEADPRVVANESSPGLVLLADPLERLPIFFLSDEPAGFGVAFGTCSVSEVGDLGAFADGPWRWPSPGGGLVAMVLVSSWS